MNWKEYFTHDFPASVVVFLVALPLCLGIALASGAPLFAGLLAGIVGGIVAGSLSGSPLSVSGPAAGLTTLVLAGINDLGSFDIFLLAVLIAGLIQLGLGYLKAGGIGHFVPASVIKGMLAAIGLILVLKQIPHAVGYDADFEGDESFYQADGENTFTEILNSLNYLSEGAIIICLASVAILLLWENKFFRRMQFVKVIPGPLVAVVAGVLLNQLFNASIPGLVIDEKHLVSVPVLSEATSIASIFTFPDFTQLANPKVYVTAFTIAIVASLETLLNIEACDKYDPFRRITPLNRELKAQGAANTVSGLLGGLPVTSVIVRSSANINSGARSKASAITHGVILLAAVALIPGVLKLIPLSCLAGILLVTGFKLTKPSIYFMMYTKGWSQFLPFIVTVVAIVFTNLLAGVFMGLLVAVFYILRTNFRQAVILVNNETNFLLKLTKDVSFLNKAVLRNNFLRIPNNSYVLIDGTESQFIDTDIKEAIIDFMETSKAKKINVELKNITL
ncbi:MAG: SulP family inorganic anion transporter [Bacteroidota bacterium]